MFREIDVGDDQAGARARRGADRRAGGRQQVAPDQDVVGPVSQFDADMARGVRMSIPV